MKILHIDSSALNSQSVSRQLTADVVAQLKRDHPDAEVTYRDLATDAPAHLSGEILGANFVAPETWNDRQRQEAALTNELIEELLAADVLVIGAPMYNFTIPSQLKAWFDRVVANGHTFRYTENGPEGLAGDKKVYVVSSRGGIYSEGPAQAMDHQETYVKTVLGFIGLTDVTVIRAEGVNMTELRDAAIRAAHAQIDELGKEAA